MTTDQGLIRGTMEECKLQALRPLDKIPIEYFETFFLFTTFLYNIIRILNIIAIFIDSSFISLESKSVKEIYRLGKDWTWESREFSINWEMQICLILRINANKHTFFVRFLLPKIFLNEIFSTVQIHLETIFPQDRDDWKIFQFKIEEKWVWRYRINLHS